jgi:hypothetical protein
VAAPVDYVIQPAPNQLIASRTRVERDRDGGLGDEAVEDPDEEEGGKRRSRATGGKSAMSRELEKFKKRSKSFVSGPDMNAHKKF